MISIDYKKLQNIYNDHIDSLISSSGLGTQCLLNHGAKNLSECPNCYYDASLKKSSNKYKNNGPIPFDVNQICPYCRGSGLHGSATTENIPMAVLWDYKSWIIKPINIENPTGFVQTISKKEYTTSIMNCQDMTIGDSSFILDGQPTPAGLGDQNYIICQWKKIRK
jgi:NAD-dependent SIR2 family protein deacetylase